MDYGAIFYDTAAKTGLRQLNSIQNQALRLSLGAYRTSPVISLLAEAGEVPLKLRRTELITKYAIKVKTQSKDPAFSFMIDKPGTDITYTIKSSKTRPLRVRHKYLLEELKTKIPQPLPKKHTGPPWLKNSIAINLDMYELQRKKTSQQTYRELFLATQELYKDHNVYFTDGSVEEGKASCAVVNNNIKKGVRLLDSLSIFTCEAAAIWLAFKLATEDQDKGYTVIFTDFMSCLTALQNTENTCSLITNIRESINSLTSNNRKVSLIWIPEHQGISGNEEGDQLAKEAVNKNIIDEMPIMALQDTKKLIKKTIPTCWNDW